MKKNNRILIVLEDTGRGGAETQALNLCTGLKQKGYDIHVLSFGAEKGAYWEDFSNLGVFLYQTGFKSKLLVSDFITLKQGLIKLKYTIKLIQLIRKINPDVIFPFTYPPNIILANLWQFTKARSCYWNQRDEGRMFKGTAKEIKSLNKVTGIVSNSLEGALFLEKFTDKPIKIIHNGVCVPNKQVDYLDSDVIRVVMIANLHGYKDHMTLLEAWVNVIKAKGNSQLELLFAGKDGSTSSEVKAFIKRHHLENSVKCLGVVPKVHELLLTCNIGVFSSNNEGLPNGILECMAAGLPVVATKINGSIEALGENYEFLVEPYNYEHFAQQLLKLINDAALRKQIGMLNRTRIQENFGIDKMINQYISLSNC